MQMQARLCHPAPTFDLRTLLFWLNEQENTEPVHLSEKVTATEKPFQFQLHTTRAHMRRGWGMYL